MYNDVVDLRAFYASSLGQVARRLIRTRLRQVWPNVSGMDLLGIGFTAPFMRPFLGEAAHIVNLMPAAQGVSFWPPEGPGTVGLSDECELPLEAESVDRVLIVHGVECTERLKPMMREIWRVLRGEGRLIVAVPNRMGLWARTERTPFGHGYPFSTSQLNRMLKESLFVPERHVGALYMPPLRSRLFLSGAGAWEKIGSRWLPGVSGITLVEAAKQLYAVSGEGERAARRRPFLVPAPQASAARFGNQLTPRPEP